MDGRLEINRVNAECYESFAIKDGQGKTAVFSPIAIIHHTGRVNSNNDTSGRVDNGILCNFPE